jgi:hypothetical protein
MLTVPLGDTLQCPAALFGFSCGAAIKVRTGDNQDEKALSLAL